MTVENTLPFIFPPSTPETQLRNRTVSFVLWNGSNRQMASTCLRTSINVGSHLESGLFENQIRRQSGRKSQGVHCIMIYLKLRNSAVCIVGNSFEKKNFFNGCSEGRSKSTLQKCPNLEKKK